jgi:hypothetical protein
MRCWPKDGTPDKPAGYQRHELIVAAAGAVLLVVIGVLSGWAHYSLSTARPVLANTAATTRASAATPLASPPMRAQMRTWLTRAQPSINALLTARHEITSAAAIDDIDGTGAACQTADGAVTSVQHHLPSPDPALTAALQRAMNTYRVGLGYCITGAQNQDGNDLEHAVTYINQGNAGLQAAVDLLECDLPNSEPRDPGVMTV